MSGDPELLSLRATSTPTDTFFPDMLQGDLLLTLNAADDAAMTTGGGVSTSSGVVTAGGGSMGGTVGSEGGVVWNVSALPLLLSSSDVAAGATMEWTVFPSTGLLRPGER